MTLRLSPLRLLSIALLSLLASQARSQDLYVGANYHPHDSNPETWKRDIALMKDAGLRVVRMGHLAWDSCEPSDGRFDFEWFDSVMDQMNAAGIKVVLDVAVRPAPLWLHHKHPTIDVFDVHGQRQYPNHRYFEDVGDPFYQQYALRFASALAKRYAKHPALLAFGIDNESGDGQISYSETVRLRFIDWLKAKYGSLDTLNRVWATQRWSRKLNDFDEVGLPMGPIMNGSPERILDFRLFVSDEVDGFLRKLIATVNQNAPGVLTTTNMWYFSARKYFDYSKIAYDGLISRGGEGLYPGNSMVHNEGLDSTLFGIARIQFENTTPFWCTEATTMTAVPGSIRKSAYASLMLGNQMLCGWTWQSMHSGEEQFLQGMVDWDGQPNRKFAEYKQIAAEFRKIEKYGFPYQPKPEAAIAFSFPSQIASAAFPESHESEEQTAFNYFNHRNVDVRVVEISHSELRYKLLVVPGVHVMDEPTAAKIRAFVEQGGTVVMTGGSAMLDEHGRVFDSTLPGRLSEVFGIRAAGFEETEFMNELSREAATGSHLHIVAADRDLRCEAPRFDVIEPKGASVIANIVGLDRSRPVVTVNPFGKGRAIYVGIAAREELLSAILDQELSRLSISTGPKVPPGVMARQIDGKHVLYLNMEGIAKRISLPGPSKSILRDIAYADSFELAPFEAEFVETP